MNAIINYLEIALESPLDSETRDNLMRSHTASKSLIYVINDLLDLTRTEEGQNLVMDEIFDLPNTVREATSMFQSDIERKNISLEIVEYPGLPKLLKGDRSRLRQAVSNIAGNAIKHTHEGGVKIEIYMPYLQNGRCQVEIAIQDTGVGMSLPKLDMLFREFEQVQTEDDLEGGTPTGCEAQPQGRTFDGLSEIPGQKTLGLGLAIVARTIRNMNGQLRLKSEEGKGSRFTISLPFTLPSEKEEIESGSQSLATREPSPQPRSMTPPLEQDPSELLLINLAPFQKTVKRKDSMCSMESSGSQNSGCSEIDRLVHAISGPRMSTSPNESSAILRSTTFRPSFSGKISMPNLRSSSPSALTTSSASQPQPGQEVIEGSTVALRAVRVPGEGPTTPISEIPPNTPTIQPPAKIFDHEKSIKKIMEDQSERFKVLVAEDDPINSKIIKKRMEKLGHEVSLTVNGAECADLFTKTGKEYDIVLMDMQVSLPLPAYFSFIFVRKILIFIFKMPIMDGGTSTARIRDFETSDTAHSIPEKHRLNGRVPIFAVSASLVEERRKEYMELGFDAWILKPVDFKRLQVLMDGIMHPNVRKSAAYQPGEWERGGWFLGSPDDAPTGPKFEPDDADGADPPA